MVERCEETSDARRSDESVGTKLRRIAEKARQEAKFRFTNLYYLMNEELLRGCFERLKDDAAAGIDNVTKEMYAIYFLGFTLYCTRNLKGNFRVGLRAEKSRLRRSLATLEEKMRRSRHLSLPEQVGNLNQTLRGQYAYYGIAGNFHALLKVYRYVEYYWHKMLRSRSRAGYIPWPIFHRIRERLPLLQPKLLLPYPKLQALAVL